MNNDKPRLYLKCKERQMMMRDYHLKHARLPPADVEF